MQLDKHLLMIQLLMNMNTMKLVVATLLTRTFQEEFRVVDGKDVTDGLEASIWCPTVSESGDRIQQPVIDRERLWRSPIT